MPDRTVIAILCSDLHLSDAPPRARAQEPDWYKAMARPLRYLRDLQKTYGCPVVCAGDIFNNWDEPARLINFAIDNLPTMYAIPGQHDLPKHRLEDIDQSAYYTLMQAGKVINIKKRLSLGNLVLHPFPWGASIVPRVIDDSATVVHLAVIHKYVWVPGAKYTGAPTDRYLQAYAARLQGYDAAVFGDNHQGFVGTLATGPDKFINVMNCGGFMRRNSDQADYICQLGLLYNNGDIGLVPLNNKGEMLEQVADKTIDSFEEIAKFAQHLKGYNGRLFDYREALDEYLEVHSVGPQVRAVLMGAVDGT